ncbi:hypothetical protein [Glycomyces buryatensis]|uniref:DUF3558 domain-containing protein n=1 Tax=Glycomyces buryatensis TaxID=2570927 RepID=A0A4S8PWI6_9ACTN|nr:hypothetical protein [Glycomyces buryatensis]THV34385.1 hypothetical protein FAB82_24335 [Glycomyces buryatensis]
MKIRKATGTAAASLAALLLLGSCGMVGGDGEGSSPDGGAPEEPQSTSGEGDSGAAAIDAEISSWDPCEVLGDAYNDLTESLRAFEVSGEFLSSPAGVGTPDDHAMCSNKVIWSEETEDNVGLAEGFVDISLVPKPSEEEASERYAELEADARDLYGEDFAENEVTGWDEGILFLGDYGVRDAFKVLVRDGSYLIVITLETGSDLVSGGSGNQADFTVEEARDHLIDTTLPGVQSAVSERLEEAGVSSGE